MLYLFGYLPVWIPVSGSTYVLGCVPSCFLLCMPVYMDVTIFACAWCIYFCVCLTAITPNCFTAWYATCLIDFMFAYLPGCLYVCMLACSSVWPLSDWLATFLYVCRSVSSTVCMAACLYGYLCVWLLVCITACLFVWLLICMYVCMCSSLHWPLRQGAA